MAPRGGYKGGVDRGAEYVRLDRRTNAEAVMMATQMGQEFEVWMEDAVQHHLYLCETLQAQERYLRDELDARSRNSYTPDKFDPRYQVTRKKPEITRTPGQGSGPTGRGYRP